MGYLVGMMVQNTLSKCVTVVNPLGLHARPAHALVTAAHQFSSDIQIIRNGESADAKSILGILTLAAESGTQLTITASGEDAEDALAALEELFLKGFDEMEPTGEGT